MLLDRRVSPELLPLAPLMLFLLMPKLFFDVDFHPRSWIVLIFFLANMHASSSQSANSPALNKLSNELLLEPVELYNADDVIDDEDRGLCGEGTTCKRCRALGDPLCADNDEIGMKNATADGNGKNDTDNSTLMKIAIDIFMVAIIAATDEYGSSPL
jgi:hypothetical protein